MGHSDLPELTVLPDTPHGEGKRARWVGDLPQALPPPSTQSVASFFLPAKQRRELERANKRNAALASLPREVHDLTHEGDRGQDDEAVVRVVKPKGSRSRQRIPPPVPDAVEVVEEEVAGPLEVGPSAAKAKTRTGPRKGSAGRPPGQEDVDRCLAQKLQQEEYARAQALRHDWVTGLNQLLGRGSVLDPAPNLGQPGHGAPHGARPSTRPRVGDAPWPTALLVHVNRPPSMSPGSVRVGACPFPRRSRPPALPVDTSSTFLQTLLASARPRHPPPLLHELRPASHATLALSPEAICAHLATTYPAYWDAPACRSLLRDILPGAPGTATTPLVPALPGVHPPSLTHLLGEGTRETAYRLQHWLTTWQPAEEPLTAPPPSARQCRRRSGRDAAARGDDVDEDEDDFIDDFTEDDDGEDESATAFGDGTSGKQALLLQGPSSSFKTTMVYTVAQALGYSVIELHSSQKRGTREMLALLEATLSHSLRREAEQGSGASAGSRPKSGSFFARRPKTASRPLHLAKESGHPENVVHLDVDVVDVDEPEAGPGQQTSQPGLGRKSLILLEDVDVLAGADKGFWQALWQMLSRSKRPFILTCSGKWPEYRSRMSYPLLYCVACLHSVRLHQPDTRRETQTRMGTLWADYPLTEANVTIPISLLPALQASVLVIPAAPLPLAEKMCFLHLLLARQGYWVERVGELRAWCQDVDFKSLLHELSLYRAPEVLEAGEDGVDEIQGEAVVRHFLPWVPPPILGGTPAHTTAGSSSAPSSWAGGRFPTLAVATHYLELQCHMDVLQDAWQEILVLEPLLDAVGLEEGEGEVDAQEWIPVHRHLLPPLPGTTGLTRHSCPGGPARIAPYYYSHEAGRMEVVALLERASRVRPAHLASMAHGVPLGGASLDTARFRELADRYEAGAWRDFPRTTRQLALDVLPYLSAICFLDTLLPASGATEGRSGRPRRAATYEATRRRSHIARQFTLEAIQDFAAFRLA